MFPINSLVNATSLILNLNWRRKISLFWLTTAKNIQQLLDSFVYAAFTPVFIYYLLYYSEPMPYIKLDASERDGCLVKRVSSSKGEQSEFIYKKRRIFMKFIL